MIRYSIILLAVLITGCSQHVNTQNIKFTNMNIDKTIDFELLEKNAKISPMSGKEGYYEYDWEYTTKDGVYVRISGNKIDGFIVWHKPPLPYFYRNYSQYYGNGNLKFDGNVIGNKSLRIGKWEYFDETGNKTKETDEDLKYGNFDYNKLLSFLHSRKNINMETGENRDGLSVLYDEKNKIWNVSVTDKFYRMTTYEIDGETGKIISEKKYQGGIE